MTKTCTLLMGLLLVIPNLFASKPQNTPPDSLSKKISKLLENSSLSTQLFMGFQYTQNGSENSNEFLIKRGYLNFKKSLTKNLSGRITPDITIDKEGDGIGDVEMRLKYCYMEYKHIGGKFITDPAIVFGEVFTPWIEFEEKINQYRVQSAHFLDKIKTVSSADFGFTITSLIGGKVDEEYQRKVSNKYPGKYGSFAVGIYNGGGYHAIEQNKNKTLQWRLSLRPFPIKLTGLQFNYTGAWGNGNTELNPIWNLHAIGISYETNNLVFSGQYFSGIGNHEGELVNMLDKSMKNNGYSIFSDVNIYRNKLSLIGRYDFHRIYDVAGKKSSDRFVFGLAYHILDRNKIIVDVDYTKFNGQSKPNLIIYELVVELSL